jgi:hypothetical protein
MQEYIPKEPLGLSHRVPASFDTKKKPPKIGLRCALVILYVRTVVRGGPRELPEIPNLGLGTNEPVA